LGNVAYVSPSEKSIQRIIETFLLQSILRIGDEYRFQISPRASS
jgi:hypothetical protein